MPLFRVSKASGRVTTRGNIWDKTWYNAGVAFGSFKQDGNLEIVRDNGMTGGCLDRLLNGD